MISDGANCGVGTGITQGKNDGPSGGVKNWNYMATASGSEDGSHGRPNSGVAIVTNAIKSDSQNTQKTGRSLLPRWLGGLQSYAVKLPRDFHRARKRREQLLESTVLPDDRSGMSLQRGLSAREQLPEKPPPLFSPGYALHRELNARELLPESGRIASIGARLLSIAGSTPANCNLLVTVGTALQLPSSSRAHRPRTATPKVRV